MLKAGAEGRREQRSDLSEKALMQHLGTFMTLTK